MVFSIDVEKAFDKIKELFIIILDKLRLEENFTT